MSLRRGQRFSMNGWKWRVAYVTESRAHCIAVSTKPVTITDRRSGRLRTFRARLSATLDISPNSAVDLVEFVR